MAKSFESARPRSEGTLAPPPSTPPLLGPYRCTEKLGEGGMGVVWRAEHRETKRVVALKTVEVPHESMLASIRREIYALRSVDHPGVVKIVDDGVHGGLPWYAMELIEGRSLRIHNDTRRSGLSGSSDTELALRRARSEERTLDPSSDISHDREIAPRDAIKWELPELLTILCGVCAALAAIHERGIVHRDLKPDNVILRASGTPVLVDFGLAYQTGGGREVLEVTGRLVGSPAYMSPEQIRGNAVDARADLYALGCMLYEAVTGQVPFTGAVQLILEQHVLFKPQRPSDFVDDVPPRLEALILKLLEKKPRDRYGYAIDVARELLELGADPSRVTLKEGDPYLYRPALAGREDVVMRLVDALETRTRGARIFLGGESGVGKTRVAAEVASFASKRGATVISGSCVDVSAEGRAFAAPPLHPFRPLLQAVADRCRVKGAAETQRLLGERGPLLAQYEPTIASLLGETPELPELGAEAAKERAISAMAATIAAFADRGQLMLLFDDMQWADELSIALFERLDDAELSKSGAVILGTYRSEEKREALDRIVRAEGSINVELGRLEPASVRAIVADMLAIAEPPGRFVDHVSRASEGNPFFVAEYLRVAMSEGVLARATGGEWSVASSDRELPMPRGLRDLVLRRFDAVSAEAQRAWRVASAIGREIEAETLLEAASLSREAGARALLELGVKQVLEEADLGKLRFSHDKLRELVLAATPDEERVEIHAGVARALEAKIAKERALLPLLAQELGHHFASANVHDKAATYLEEAGHVAQANGAAKEAAEIYGRALAEIDELAAPTELAGEPLWLARGRIERRLAAARFEIGELVAAEEAALRALATLGRRSLARDRASSATKSSAFFVALRALFSQARHFFGLRAKIEADARERERLREISLAAQQLGVVLFFENEPGRSFAASLEATTAAEGLGPSSELARSYANLAIAFGYVPWRKVALHYARLADDSARAVGDPATTCWVERMKGMRELGQGNLALAGECLQTSLSISLDLGDLTAEIQSRALLADTRRLRGDLEGALELQNAVEALARRIKNQQGLVWAHGGRAAVRLDQERWDDCVADLEASAPLVAASGDVAQKIFDGQLAEAYAMRGDWEAAERVAKETLALTRSAENAAYQCYQGLLVTAEVFLSLAEHAPDRRDDLLECARGSIAALAGHARLFRLAAPPALVLRGALLAATGKRERGVAEMRKGEAAARAIGALAFVRRAERLLQRYAPRLGP